MHSCKIEVRFADIDRFNHVNNAVYLSYAEQARIMYCDEVLGDTIDWKKNGLILAKAEANYLRPIHLYDNIIVETECTKIGNKSLHLYYRIFKITDTEKLEMCNGLTILVGYDYVNNCSMPILPEWRKAIEEHTNR